MVHIFVKFSGCLSEVDGIVGWHLGSCWWVVSSSKFRKRRHSYSSQQSAEWEVTWKLLCVVLVHGHTSGGAVFPNGFRCLHAEVGVPFSFAFVCVRSRRATSSTTLSRPTSDGSQQPELAE